MPARSSSRLPGMTRTLMRPSPQPRGGRRTAAARRPDSTSSRSSGTSHNITPNWSVKSICHKSPGCSAHGDGLTSSTRPVCTFSSSSMYVTHCRGVDLPRKKPRSRLPLLIAVVNRVDVLGVAHARPSSGSTLSAFSNSSRARAWASAGLSSAPAKLRLSERPKVMNSPRLIPRRRSFVAQHFRHPEVDLAAVALPRRIALPIAVLRSISSGAVDKGRLVAVALVGPDGVTLAVLLVAPGGQGGSLAVVLT